MKTKYAILATALSLGLATSAHSQTVVRISGSTAFRSSVHNAILAIMSGETYAYTGSTLSSASQSNFRGTIGGEDVLIKCSWSGSVGGIQALTNPSSRVDLFLANSVVGNGAGQSGVAAGTADEESDIAMSDVFQNSTLFTSPELVDNRVAVVPFKFLAGKGAPTSLTNITSLAAQSLYGAGKVPLALVTGNSADRTAKLFAMGRDNSSGTRLTSLADTGLGALATVVQYTFNGSAYTNVGDGGYSSGGNVATALGQTSNSTIGYNIAYVGLSDATTAIANSAKELTYNGVAYSEAAVREGSYTLWGYQHLFYTDALNGVALDVATALTAELINTPGAAGLKIGNIAAVNANNGTAVAVSRVAEGAPVGNRYTTP